MSRSDLSEDPSPSAIRGQLDVIQRSAAFAGSDRLLAFLQFIVDETLDGSSASLKESVIGNAVYKRDSSYDPRIDSTVRVEARRLRGKLKDYYAGEGRRDPVIICLATGSYVPTFAANPNAAVPSGQREEAVAHNANIFEKGPGAAVAIMPFRSLSTLPEDESFADGLTDELMFAMRQARGLRIISRSAAFQYKDRNYKPADLASELAVDAVLLGTVRREGELIRVTIEVSDTSGFVVWTDRFDAAGDERMRLQEQIAATLLNRIQLDSSQMRALEIRPGPVALEAYATVYRARQLLDEQTPGALYEALDLFSKVSRSAPDYARGHSGVADSHCELFRLGLIDHPTAIAAAKPAALRALDIDPQSAEAHTALATISAWLEWDRTAAEAGFRRALKLGNSARAARVYGVLLTILERHEEAERLFREARSIEPFSVQQDIAEAVSHYQARRYQTLLETRLRTDARRAPVEALVYRALANIFSGDTATGRSFIADIEHGAAKHPDLAFARAEIEAWLGEPKRARRLLDADGGAATCFARATLAAALNEGDQSLDALAATIDRREISMAWLQTDARFDFLRDSQDFHALLKRLDGLRVH